MNNPREIAVDLGTALSSFTFTSASPYHHIWAHRQLCPHGTFHIVDHPKTILYFRRIRSTNSDQPTFVGELRPFPSSQSHRLATLSSPGRDQSQELTPRAHEPQATMEGSSRTPSWQKNGNRSSPSTDSISSSDTMMDCAESLDATLSPSPINTDSGGPSDKHRTTSASTPRPPITGISSVDVPHDSAHHSGHVTPDIQRDNQQSAQNRMAIDFILNSSPPNLEDSPEPSVTKKNSTAQVPSSVTSASAGEKTSI